MSRAVALTGALAMTVFTAACGGSATTADFERAAGTTGESALAVDAGATATPTGGAETPGVTGDPTTAVTGGETAGSADAASGSASAGPSAAAGSAGQPGTNPGASGQSPASASRSAGSAGGSAAGGAASPGGAAAAKPGPAKPGQSAAPAPGVPAPGSPAAPAKGDNSPVRIGAICNCSGPAGSSLAPPLDALRAWVQYTNAKGGINGHPIELIVVDDRSDPSRARAAAQDMVENRGVVAIIPFAVLTHSGLGPYVKEKRIPLIGGDHASENYCTNEMYFPQGTCREGWAWGGMKALAELFKERNLGVLVCVESEICPFTLDVAKKYATSLGFKLVYSGQASIASPDFSAQCLSAKSAGVDVLLIQMELNSMRRIGGQCGRQGFKPKYGSFQQDETFLSVPEYEGMPLGNQTFSYSYEGPETAEFRKALAQYAPQASNGGYFSNAWAAAKTFEKAASQVKGPITSAAILEQLWTFKNETLANLTVPMTFVKDQPTVPPFCVYVTTVGKGKVDAPFGLKPLCR
ncbi:MAG TPA: ABC transporter substrate-binding protein [Acidimicrobiia bacterium]|nr:ABC transporter substrate-binding protein [Acidimicrobiia bacterium]